MDKVIFSFLGTTLDAGYSAGRWERWRPTIALCQQEDMIVNRLVLFHGGGHDSLLKLVIEDIHRISPETVVEPVRLQIRDPWNFVDVYSALHDFVRRYPFNTEDFEYLVHLTTGTHVAQICLFLLLEARYFPARIVETFSHGAPDGDAWRGSLQVIDLNLATYDQLAKRFKRESLDSQGLLKGGIETKNAQFNQLIGRIEKVAL